MTYLDLGLLRKAKSYLLKSLDVRLKTFDKHHSDVANSLYKLGVFSLKNGQNNEALDYFLEYLKCIKEPLDFADAYNYIGVIFDNINKLDSSEYYYHLAEKIYLNASNYDTSGLAWIYHNLGVHYAMNKDFSAAKSNLLHSLNLRKKAFGLFHEDMPSNYLAMCSLYIMTGEIEDSKKFLDTASLIIDAFGFELNSSNILPRMIMLENMSEIMKYEVEHNIDIAIPLDLLNKISNKLKEINLHISENNDFNNFSTELISSRSKTFFNLIASFSRREKISSVRDNYSFYFNESSKSSLLIQSLQETDALAFANIPDSLLQKEHDLRIDITWREKQRQEKLNSGLEETDTTVLRISSILFDLRQEYEALKTRFEQEYPEYYRLKYDLSTTSLAYVQDTLLSPTQTLLEYFVGDSSIFIFTVGEGRYDVVEIKKDSLEHWVKQLQGGLYGYFAQKPSERTDELYRQTMRLYIEAAQRLYAMLIAPVQAQLTEETIIVPDGVLGYVPFEALLKAKPTQASNFATYPFLVKDHRISYCYSATLLREMKEKRHKQPPTKPFVAFAPFYEGSYEKAESTVDVRFDTLADGRDTVIVDDVVTRKEFKSLPASGEETATAAKLWRGDYFLNSDATEQRFNEVAGDYRIVHLSTHGIADARVGDYSYLAFAEQKDSIENEFLYVRDLYNTQLNADLVVLSACETAQGELQRGEGIISLARAFAYAGAKSIVTTLWTVDDSASKDLTKEFYLQLKKGKTKDAALQAAKLKLVNGKDAKRQHPFFWAGFIGVGDMSAVK
ncbi:MAG: CHAT domain-containing protein [Saprospiraceae bacterium]|nr:CHAT domain-containing protein [Saprospiraceae bacterium]